MIFRVLSVLAVCVAVSGCEPSERKSTHQDPSSGLSGISLLYAPDGGLDGSPNVYKATLNYSDRAAPLEKLGDLPEPGATLNIGDLPPGSSASLTLDLFSGGFLFQQQTHHCTSEERFTLIKGETATLELTCITIANDAVIEPVKVFLKVAAIAVELVASDNSRILEGRDLSTPYLFANTDANGKRISLRSDLSGVTLHIGGDLTFKARTGDQHPTTLLLRGETVSLLPIGGRLLATNPGSAHLTIESPTAFYLDQGILGLVLPIKITTDDGSLEISGRLVEEPAEFEFTLVSYNVENLFDQVDDERNSGYGDYRITPNENGFSSNYGELAEFEGELLTFTQIKARGIKRALIGIESTGPSVVALQEIESAAALNVLFLELENLGYSYQAFSGWTEEMQPNAVGLGIISKYPILTSELLAVADPEGAENRSEPIRPIMKVTLEVAGHPLVVYNNHWKSKGGPESFRLAAGMRLEEDVATLPPMADFVIVGDLNSNYNEKSAMEARHNDTNGITGINDVLKAQGDELLVLRGQEGAKYNLHYELSREARRTAFHRAFGWSSMDHIIISSGLYDNLGITYVDGSFTAPSAEMPDLAFLFSEDGTTNRWNSVRNGPTTVHAPGGYSDHTPIFARFRITRLQRPSTIKLEAPGRPDATDHMKQESAL